MKNFVFVILVMILLVAIGGVFWFWQENGSSVVQITQAPSPTLASQRAPNYEPLPTGVIIEPTPTYQKPAEDAIIKFPVFNYHHIRPMPSVASSTISDRAFTVSPEGFEAHLKYFQDNGYQVVSIYDLLDYFDIGRPLSQKAVAITFDDGRYGQYQWAFPLLKKYNMTATFFIIVNNVGKTGVLTWEQIKTMSDGGMVIGSHTLSHSHLSALNNGQLRQELADSKMILEEKIGKRVDLLSYPGGDYNAYVVEAVKKAGYQAAMGVYKIIDQTPKARFAIRRFHADDDLKSISDKLVGY